MSTFMTLGIALPDASMALTRKRFAAAASRFAVSRNSIVWPVESTAQYSIPALALDAYIGLVYPVGLVGGPKIGPAALIEFRCIRLNPPPNAAGIHLKAPFSQHLSHVLVRQGIS